MERGNSTTKSARMNRLSTTLAAITIFAILLATDLNAQSQTDNRAAGQQAEFMVAAELARRNYMVSMTYGNAKEVDLIATEPSGQKLFTVQVKLRRTGQKAWDLGDLVSPTHIYVFVRFYKNADAEFFLISSVDAEEIAGKTSKTRWINRSALHPDHLNTWDEIFPKQNPP